MVPPGEVAAQFSDSRRRNARRRFLATGLAGRHTCPYGHDRRRRSWTPILAAWNAHDSAKAASYFADDVVYYDASVGAPVVGRDAAKTGVIDNFLNAVPDAAGR